LGGESLFRNRCNEPNEPRCCANRECGSPIAAAAAFAADNRVRATGCGVVSKLSVSEIGTTEDNALFPSIPAVPPNTPLAFEAVEVAAAGCNRIAATCVGVNGPGTDGPGDGETIGDVPRLRNIANTVNVPPGVVGARVIIPLRVGSDRVT
jgi:hypothetical protein